MNPRWETNTSGRRRFGWSNIPACNSLQVVLAGSICKIGTSRAIVNPVGIGITKRCKLTKPPSNDSKPSLSSSFGICQLTMVNAGVFEVASFRGFLDALGFVSRVGGTVTKLCVPSWGEGVWEMVGSYKNTFTFHSERTRKTAGLLMHIQRALGHQIAGTIRRKAFGTLKTGESPTWETIRTDRLYFLCLHEICICLWRV